MQSFDLSGHWEMAAGEAAPSDPAFQRLAWRPGRVPGCWEVQAFPKDLEGPVWYRRLFQVPEEWAEHRVLLRFRAASYWTQVWVNGQRAGEHEGSWDSFEVDVTDLVRPGETAEVAVGCVKQGDRFPLRETLAGFIPDVAMPFGGLWQGVDLLARGEFSLGEVFLRARGRFLLARLALRSFSRDTAPGRLHVRILDPRGKLCVRRSFRLAIGPGGVTSLSVQVPVQRPIVWSPDEPSLYSVFLALEVGGRIVDRLHRRVGFREVRTRGWHVLLNGSPVYFRGVLHWGFYPESIAPAPDRRKVREELRQIKAMGFNLVKLCLWVPPEEYLEVADEEGMLLWQELPMWLPRVTPAFKERVRREYAALLRQRRGHPSQIIYSLGCELDSSVDAPFLRQLYRMACRLDPDVLVRDNSGSGECYNGLTVDFADFYDYHFYADLHFMRDLLDAFAAGWRRPRPWFFGEFADADTFRDAAALARILESNPSGWWLRSDPEQNPLVRTRPLPVTSQREALAQSGLSVSSDELRSNSYRHALLVRKWLLEETRSRPQTAGYVVTGLRDVPITTPGLLDDLGQAKWRPEELRPFNGDTVLLLKGMPRRRWIHGGDRIWRSDDHCHWSGSTVTARLAVSHYGRPGRGVLTWTVRDESGHELAACGSPIGLTLRPGTVSEAAAIEFVAPRVASPQRLELEARLATASAEICNCWPLWVFPHNDVAAKHGTVDLFDPGARLSFLVAVGIGRYGIAGGPVLVASALGGPVYERVRDGGRVLLVVHHRGGDVPTMPAPFWREAVKVVLPHPCLGDFPHQGYTDLQFYGMATDLVIDTGSLARLLEDGLQSGSGRSVINPVIRRLDAREFWVGDYLAEIKVGEGRLVATTLRFQGGMGDQPDGLDAAVAGRYLLGRVLDYLAS